MAERRLGNPRVGLCVVCVHARAVVSGRGSTFWMCELSRSDARFRKYPPLPVRRCEGFSDQPDTGAGNETQPRIRPPGE